MTIATLVAGTRTTRTAGPLIASGVSALALALAFTVLTWLAAPVPSADSLGFSDLKKLTETPGVPTTTVQHAFFSWLGWILLVVVVVTAAAAALIRTRSAGAVATLAALVALILQLLAAKGPLNWSEFFDTFDQFRVGAYVALGSWSVLLAVSIYTVVASRRDTV